MSEMTPERLQKLTDEPFKGELANTVKDGIHAAVSAWKADRAEHEITRHQLEDAYSAARSLKESLLQSGKRIKALLRLCSDADNAAQVERQRFRARIKALEARILELTTIFSPFAVQPRPCARCGHDLLAHGSNRCLHVFCGCEGWIATPAAEEKKP